MIHLAETLALSMRLAGVRTKQVATSISFVNASFLVSRMSNMLQAPLLGALVDAAVNPNSVFTPLMLEGYFSLDYLCRFLGESNGSIFNTDVCSNFRKRNCCI